MFSTKIPLEFFNKLQIVRKQRIYDANVKYVNNLIQIYRKYEIKQEVIVTGCCYEVSQTKLP